MLLIFNINFCLFNRSMLPILSTASYITAYSKVNIVGHLFLCFILGSVKRPERLYHFVREFLSTRQIDFLINNVRFFDSVSPRHLFATVPFLCNRPGPRVSSCHPVYTVASSGFFDNPSNLRSVFVFWAECGNNVHSLDRFVLLTRILS